MRTHAKKNKNPSNCAERSPNPGGGGRKGDSDVATLTLNRKLAKRLVTLDPRFKNHSDPSIQRL